MKQFLDPRAGHAWRAIITACALIVPAACFLFGSPLSDEQVGAWSVICTAIIGAIDTIVGRSQ